ncbi:MAG: ribosomal L7Ae/L30e/S12e/Gadd45 family protein [Clostridiales bacterium]|nr:ribosomal L7Ae/L30e/S12e/Gadd45 family protein [Clostridiales bacterium]
MNEKEKILKFIGLAVRAGKIVSGFDQTVSEIRKGRVELLILSKDISRNTLGKLLDIGDLPDAYSFSTAEELGRATGKRDRAIIGITDSGFAGKLRSMFDQYEEEDNK